MSVSFQKSTLAKGSVIFIVLSLAIIIGILIWTTDHETWSHFSEFQLSVVPLIIGLAILRWLVDGMAFVSMAKHSAHSKIKLTRATLIRLEGNFVGTALPILVGTMSMHAYLLRKEKMKIHESVAITALRAILPIFIFIINIPIYFLVKTGFTEGKFFSQLLKVISLPIAFIVVFIILTLFYPDKIKNLASSLIRWWGKIKVFHIERIMKIEEKYFHEIDQLSKIFWTYLRERKLTLILASIWIFMAFFLEYIIAYYILIGFGFHPPLIKVLAIQSLIRPIILFAPTPGGAGFWEFTYLGFFSLYMPQYLIGIAVLFWRLIITYIPAIIGSLFLSKDLHRHSKLRDIIQEHQGLSEQEQIENNEET
jgi:uncharacterized protein (TIRG00374 family)